MIVEKIFGLCLSLLLVAAMFSGCGASPSSNHPAAGSSKQQSEENTETTLSNEMEDSENMDSNTAAKNLVVYFSMPETTEPENMSREEELSTVVIDGEVLGNTQYVAYIIAENTGADIFRIEPVTPYPLDHSELEDIAQKEQADNFRPEIAGTVENIEQYDTIFLDFPTGIMICRWQCILFWRNTICREKRSSHLPQAVGAVFLMPYRRYRTSSRERWFYRMGFMHPIPGLMM